MKRIIPILFCLALALTFLTSCAQPQQPLTAAELLNLGEKYLLELDYEQALVQFLAVIEIEPMNPRGYTGAAEAYVGLGRVEAAVAVLEQGLEVIEDETIQAKLTELTKAGDNLIPNSHDDDSTEYNTTAQGFTSNEIAVMEAVYQGTIREDYMFLYDCLLSQDFADLFVNTVRLEYSYDTLNFLTWVRSNEIITFRQQLYEDGETEGYGVEFGNKENGTYYHIWDIIHPITGGVMGGAEFLILSVLNNKDGLGNGRFCGYIYTPQADMVLLQRSGVAVNGWADGILRDVETYSDGSTESTEWNYIDGLYYYLDGSSSKKQVGGYYDEITGQLEFWESVI
jgi:tetratricopeptide (TPR) repeat protein